MITVIIPAYERPNDLRTALHSLAAQTQPNFKVIVSDDHSTEDLKAVCQEFPSLNIKYIRTYKNFGCAGNRNFALQALYENPTEYVMFLDSDDVLSPIAVARLEQAISTNQADIICTDIARESFGPEQEIISAEKSKTWMHGKIYSTIFLRDNNAHFPDGVKTNEDLAFNLSLYAYEPESYLLHEPLYVWRNNPNSITQSKDNTLIRNQCKSIDYIEAIYYAYTCYPKGKLTKQMIANIINCYSYWQNGVIYGFNMDPFYSKMKRMLHNKQTATALVKIYNYPDTDFQLKQWCVKNDSLVFYGQTFGAWVMKFFKPEEIAELIQETQKEKENA